MAGLFRRVMTLSDDADASTLAIHSVCWRWLSPCLGCGSTRLRGWFGVVDDGRVLADVVEYLRCPVCEESLALSAGALRCAVGHSFDVARQGYANLLTGNARPGTADTPEMVRARESFLGAGHFSSLTGLLGDCVASGSRGGVVLDAGAGTGHYLRVVLEQSHSVGIALDISKHAARRAARAHARIGAVVADLWRPLPVRTGAVDVVINVFAPRNAPEFHRVLRPGGTMYAVTPSRRHLGTLVSSLGLLSVDEHKDERIEAALRGYFVLDARQELETEAVLGREDVATLVGMGPSAHHVSPEDLSKRLAELPEPLPVPLSFVLATFRRA